MVGEVRFSSFVYGRLLGTFSQKKLLMLSLFVAFSAKVKLGILLVEEYGDWGLGFRVFRLFFLLRFGGVGERTCW